MSWKFFPETFHPYSTCEGHPLEEEEENFLSQDSWVELAPPSRGSLCSSLEASLLADAIQSDSNKGSRHSPKSLQSPNVEWDPKHLDAVKYRLARDLLPPGQNTDWIWDWSSRPEALPPKELRFRHPGSSAVTTPPNSPVPTPTHQYPLSLRHSKLIPLRLDRVHVLVGIVVSNLFSVLLGAYIGFCLCKRMTDWKLPTDG